MNSANASSGGAKTKKNRKKGNKNPGAGQAVADSSVGKGNTSTEESLDSQPTQNGGAAACNSSNTRLVKDMALDNNAGNSDHVIKVVQTSGPCAVGNRQETFAVFIPEMKVAPAEYVCSALDMPSSVSLSVAKSQTNCIHISSKSQSNDSSNVSSVSNSKTDTGNKASDTNNVSKQNVDKPEDLVKGMKDLSVKNEQPSEKNIKSNSKASDISHGPAAAVASDSSEAPQKSKAELSRERRALQEAQRAAKAARMAEGGGANQKKDKDNAQQAAPKPPQKQEKKPPMVADTPAKQTVPSDKSAPEKKAEKEKKPQDNLAAQQSRDQKVRTAPHLQLDDHRTVKRLTKKLEKQNLPNRTAETLRKMGLFRHLPQYERNVPLTEQLKFDKSNLHPAIIKLGLQYADGVICGSNARCVALLHALKKVIADYTTPPNTELCRDLEANLSPAISFLQQCRPLSVSMGNAIRHIKRLITTTPTSCSDHEAKQNLCLEIDEFLKNKIKLAAVAISGSAITKINDGDVILVYACSSLIKTVLCTAYDAKKKFSVIVVDSRPKEEGREMMRRLVRHGIPCSYVLINDVSNVMRQVSQVFLGAHALLANGYMMSRVGSSQVALVASAFNVPVIVCCETYKFSEKVWTDSFVANELGDPSDLVRTTDGRMGALRDWVSVPKLNLLNLVYDITPPQLINMVITDITEFGLVPCTSVPVVLRVKNTEIS